jgi:cell division cycle protein 37
LKKVLQDLEDEEKKIKDKEEEIEKKDKLIPWNIDTIGQDGFTKTIINTKLPRKDEDAGLSDEEKEKRMKQFVKENEKKLKEFGMLRKYDDSKKFLQDHSYLVCENTANYLVIWCINLEMEEVSYLHRIFNSTLFFEQYLRQLIPSCI